MIAIHAKPETEARLLRVAMIDVANASKATADGVCADVFSVPEHRQIWNAIAAAASIDGCTEVEAVYRQLEGLSGGCPKPVQARFFEVTGIDEPTHTRLPRYIADVLDLHRQRKLVSALDAARETAAQNAPNFCELWESVEPHLHAAQEAGADTRHRSLADVAAQAAAWLLNPEVRPSAPTPWPAWDLYATSVSGGELVVIAGRPGSGKTTLAGNIADNLTMQGKNVAFFSLEMRAEEVVTRLARGRAGRDGIGDDKRAKAAVAAQMVEIGKSKMLRIYEANDAPSVSKIEAACRLLASSPAGLSAVFVDYLDLVSPPSELKRESREQQLAAMTRRFKLLAQAIGCPVFLLAQLNRDSEKEDRKPRPSDLRGSGAIEQDADRVWLLYIPKPAPDAPIQPADASEIEVALFQAKCRNGPQGIEAVLRFNRPTFSFKPA